MAEETSKNKKTPQILSRSLSNKILGGVAGGLGQYFDVDPNIVRLIFVILALLKGAGIVIYLILWVLLPSQKSIESKTNENIKENVDEIKEKAKKIAEDLKISSNGNRSQYRLGVFVLVLGVFFLLGNFGFFNYFDMTKLWPVFLIMLGMAILFK